MKGDKSLSQQTIHRWMSASDIARHTPAKQFYRSARKNPAALKPAMYWTVRHTIRQQK